MTREAVTYVAIDIRFCANTYGESPCTAELGVTGSDKCYNTRNLVADCQDTENFVSETKTILFAGEHVTVPPSIDAIANLVDVDIRSPMLKPGESLGERTGATITFRNHPHGDAGLDPYIADRSYIPFNQGTFWGKFRARNPYIKGRPIRIYRGFSDQDLEDMEIIHLFVDNFAGPTVTGIFTIKCVDALRFLDGDKALAPAVSPGYLAVGIDDTETSIQLDPSGIGDSYGTSGLWAIGEEIVSFTRSPGSDIATIVRGLHGSEAASHDAEDTVQEVLEYDAQRADQILYHLADNYTDLDAPARINTNDWAEEITSYSNVLYSAIIPQPTPVAQLYNELIVQVGLVINDDVINQKIKLRTLRPVPPTSKRFTADNVLKGTFEPKDQQDKRVTLVITYYNQKNPFQNLDDRKNYHSVLASLSDQGVYEQSAIRIIYSRWIPQFGRSIVQRLNAMILSRYSLPPRQIPFGLLRGTQLIEGEGIQIESPGMESADGSLETVPAVVVSVDRTWDKSMVIAEEMRFQEEQGLVDEKLIVIEVNAFNLNLRTIFDQVYASVESGDDVKFIIESGVIVGSTGHIATAMRVGSWPAGVNLTLIVNGRIQGGGGDAAEGLLVPDDGGTALFTDYPITIDVTNGEIWGGGGGGDNENVTIDGHFFASKGGSGAGYRPGRYGNSGTTEAGGPSSFIFAYSTFLQGYAGGDPGQAGSGPNGGAAGNAIEGVSHVTFIGTGDRRGPEIG